MPISVRNAADDWSVRAEMAAGGAGSGFDEWVAGGVSGSLTECSRYDWGEHAVGRSAVEVVDAVCFGESVERCDLTVREPVEPSVDVHVVNERVCRAVGGDADADGDQHTEPVPVEPGEESEIDDRSEHHRVPVVCFEPLEHWTVVAAMEELADAVHDPTVDCCGERLHHYERDDRDQDRGRSQHGTNANWQNQTRLAHRAHFAAATTGQRGNGGIGEWAMGRPGKAATG